MQNTQWFDELREKYTSGISNFFILTGNIGDYVVPGILLVDYLYDKLTKEMKFNSIITMNMSAVNADNNPSTRSVSNVASSISSEGIKTAVIVKYSESLFPNTPDSHLPFEQMVDFITLYDTINSKSFITSDNLLIFVAESQYSINQKFLGANTRSYVIEVGFPNEKERYDCIQYLDGPEVTYKSELSQKEFARLTAGLTRVSIEDIVLQAKHVETLHRDFIMDRKTQLIKKEYGEVIDVLDSEGFSFKDFAGQDHLKKYHMEAIISPMKNGDIDIVPKGILFTGPPGTGKTMFARCLAGEAGINFVELKMSKIKDKWVGESAKRFDKALACIRSIAPVGVFIDEIDQAFSRGEGQSNTVQSDLFAMFLTILSEPKNRGQILWIGATNYPNKLDEALKRTGRMDKKMPFLPPNKPDRIAVLKIYLDKARIPHKITPEQLAMISDMTEGYTQAELEGIVVKTIEIAVRKKKRVIEWEDLEYALKCVKKTSNEKIQEMVDLAIEECNDLEFLPVEYQKK